MALDRLLGHEQLLRDRPVRAAVGRQLRDAALGRRERRRAGERDPPGARARGEQLLARAAGQAARAAAFGELGGLAQRLPRVAWTPAAPQSAAELDEGPGALDRRRLLAQVIWSTLPTIAGTPPTPSVELRLPPPPDADRYRELFGVEPRFRCAIDRIGLLNAYLDAPLPQADGATLHLFEHQCDTLLQRRAAQVGVAGLVYDRLSRAAHGVPTMEMVAADIHMATRTLRRKLRQEGVSFREIDRTARLERAEELLRDPDLSIAAIAQRTGYANSSSFVHAFQRWRGTTPGAHRAQQRT